jgi:hypothetical protein
MFEPRISLCSHRTPTYPFWLRMYGCMCVCLYIIILLYGINEEGSHASGEEQVLLLVCSMSHACTSVRISVQRNCFLGHPVCEFALVSQPVVLECGFKDQAPGAGNVRLKKDPLYLNHKDRMLLLLADFRFASEAVTSPFVCERCVLYV